MRMSNLVELCCELSLGNELCRMTKQIREHDRKKRRTAFPNLTCFSVSGVTRSGSVSVNERLTFVFMSEEQIPLMFAQGVLSPHRHPAEDLPRGTAPYSLPGHQSGLPAAAVGSPWASWRGDAGRMAGGSQSGRKAGTSQHPTASHCLSSPHVRRDGRLREVPADLLCPALA